MILVTGGAGYIGSHIVKELLADSNDILILDNLSTGHFATLQTLKNIAENDSRGSLEWVIGDMGDEKLLKDLLSRNTITAVIHLAAFSQVGESMRNPGKYFSNNVAKTICLMECMRECGVKNMVFSSSAAVYGNPLQLPISENHPTLPANVYGQSKLMVEQIVQWYQQIYGINYIILRYFNAAGADPQALLGENHNPETHLIPIIIRYVLGLESRLAVFGGDYPTLDGTCIRDYVHVSDLAHAHVLALDALNNGVRANIYNLSNGYGCSVKKVINTVSLVANREIVYDIEERRPGDPAVLIASTRLIKEDLGWEPSFSRLEDIVAHAWQWFIRQ